MRDHIFVFGCLCSVIVIINAVPLPANNQELDVLQIPLTDGKELDVLTIGAKDQEEIIAERNKRTIGLLRELFPDLTKQIDGIVNRIIAQVIRVAGPSVFSAVLGNRPSTQKPEFAADFDDDDDDDEDDEDSGNDLNSNESKTGTRVVLDLPTFAPETAASSISSTLANQ